MATPVFCCGFECGLAGTVGQHWTLTGTGAFNTSIVRTGARSVRVNPSANVGRFSNTFISGTVAVMRAYIYFTTLPNISCELITVLVGTTNVGAIFNASDNTIMCGRVASGSLTTGSGGVVVTTGRWYRVDVAVDVTNNPWTNNVKVDGVSTNQQTNAVAANTITVQKLGNEFFNSTFDAYFDDYLLSQTLADYPLGNGAVGHFVPTSDGTHTATTTTIVKGTVAVPVGANVAGATDVFNWVNGVPLLGGATDNTRLVNQQTAGTTLYAEVVFGPAPGIGTPGTAPRAVEVITADREATTATGDFTTKLNDNGTENTIIARGVVAGVITDRYARKHYATAPTGGAWKVVSGAGNFNNIRARFGYASDATPDQYWRGIMIEAEFPEPPQKVIQVKQAVNRASTY